MKRQYKEKCAIAFLTLIMLSMAGFAAMSAVYAETPHPADCMWVEPGTIGFSSDTVVGTRFNVTIWLNTTSPTNSWQYCILFNKTTLTALRGGYSGNGKSLWSGDLPVDTVPFSIDHQNSTHDYATFGEVLKSSANLTVAGSLSWIEFNITRVPSAGVVWTQELRLDTPSPPAIFGSFIMDPEFNELPLTFDEAIYTIPEFPATTVLIAFFAITCGVILISRKGVRQKLVALRSSKL